MKIAAPNLCIHCDKIPYGSRGAAEHAATIARKRRILLYVYYSPPCGCFHLSGAAGSRPQAKEQS